jgi:hypothetical protein
LETYSITPEKVAYRGQGPRDISASHVLCAVVQEESFLQQQHANSYLSTSQLNHFSMNHKHVRKAALSMHAKTHQQIQEKQPAAMATQQQQNGKGPHQALHHHAHTCKPSSNHLQRSNQTGVKPSKKAPNIQSCVSCDHKLKKL